MSGSVGVGLPVFDERFLVGAATSAHQTEGSNVASDLWDAEWAGTSLFREPSGDACDSFHRYGEDISLLAAAGLDAYRFGIEWARIEPEDGWFSRSALDHYRRMVGTCLEYGVTPIPTLQHFTVPKWFAQDGGWESERAADRFGLYVESVMSHLGDLLSWVCTINEANLTAMLSETGFAAVGHRNPDSGTAHVVRPRRDRPRPPIGGFPSPKLAVMARAHHRAAEAVRSSRPEVGVGWTLSLQDYQAAPGGEELVDRYRRSVQLDWLDACAGDDFVGVQTYTRVVYGPGGQIPIADAPVQQAGWEVYPDALQAVVRFVSAHTELPILVSEHGIATADDEQRIAYTARALDGLSRCAEDGIDLRGYLHWSLLDNFEWMSGYAITFGLIDVDRETFERRPKPSLAWLGEVARARRAFARPGISGTVDKSL